MHLVAIGPVFDESYPAADYPLTIYNLLTYCFIRIGRVYLDEQAMEASCSWHDVTFTRKH